MERNLDIIEVTGRMVIDSQANPGIEAEVILRNGAHGRAMVSAPGETEAKTEAEKIRECLTQAILLRDASGQADIDRLLLREYGKSAGVLALSMAVARAAGAGQFLPLYRYLGGTKAPILPVPMLSMICGGETEEKGIDFQDLMVIPQNTVSFREHLRMGTEVYQALKKILLKDGFDISTGDFGGFAPDLKHGEEALHYIQNAIVCAGYEPGIDVKIGIWAEADHLYKKEDGVYCFFKESRHNGIQINRDQKDMMDYYLRLADGFPISFLFNGLSGEAEKERKQVEGMLGHRICLAFQDLDCSHAAVIGMRGAGTVTETLNRVRQAKCAGQKVVITSDLIETEESFVADLAVAAGADYIRCGAPSGGESTSKYNELLRLEEFYYNRKQSMG